MRGLAKDIASGPHLSRELRVREKVAASWMWAWRCLNGGCKGNTADTAEASERRRESITV